MSFLSTFGRGLFNRTLSTSARGFSSAIRVPGALFRQPLGGFKQAAFSSSPKSVFGQNNNSRMLFTSSSSSSSSSSSMPSMTMMRTAFVKKSNQPVGLGGASRRSYGSSSGSSGSGSSTGFFSQRALYLVGGFSAAGLLLNAASGFATTEMSTSSGDSFDETTRKRLTATYMYVLGGLVTTAGSAVAMFRAGLPEFMARRPFVFLGLSLVGTFGASMAVQATPYGATIPKHAAFAVFNIAIAASLCPLVAVAPSILLNAAGATAAMMGGLSLLAASAPSESFLWMRGPLTVGMGVIFAASLGSAFFPAVPMLYSLTLYGGLAVFGGFALYDTSNVIHRAKSVPAGYFDPINNAMRIYMDTVQIFIRLVAILQGGNNKRK